MQSIMRLLFLASTIAFVDGGLHGAGDPVGIEENPAFFVASGAAGRLG